MKLRHLALAALLIPALPAQAQQAGMEAFNPFTMLAPIMTPLGAMLVPIMAPMNNQQGPFNPAVMNNPMAMMPYAPNMPLPAPNFAAPQGMVPFSGLQATPQSFGMAPAQFSNPMAMPQMANPFAANPFAANPYASMPFVFPNMPAQTGFPSLPSFPMPFPPAR